MAIITGAFYHADDAHSAVEELLANGWTREAISVLTAQQEPEHSPHPNLAVKDAEKGAMIGGLAGLFVVMSEIAVPGVGPILIGGWIAATLLGAGVGAAAGGLGGLLAEAGMSQEDARSLAERVHRGETLVIVHFATSGEQQASVILKRHHPTHITEG